MVAISFSPVMPDEEASRPLVDRAAALVAESLHLDSAAPGVTAALAPLLRSMNSYYSNKIEGQHTRPTDIQRALLKQFDADAQQARKQRLAIAHIDAELALERSLPTDRAALYAPELVQQIHAELYHGLPEEERISDDGLRVAPGQWRTSNVTAGRHRAPDPEEVPALLAQWQRAYAGLPGLERAIIGACCSHHRLLWIHPFLDGNGRTARLHSHLVFQALGLTRGIWSPLRGMARDQEGYYARLNNADLARRNDLDGRGPLSQEELVNFTKWMLDLCLDQARFMRDLLALAGFKDRLADLLRWLAAHPWKIGSETSAAKMEALDALHYVSLAGPLERSRFIAMTGLSQRTGRRVLSTLLDFGLLNSDSLRSPVHFAVPLRSLRFLFPRLWPEAEADTSSD